MSHAKAFLGAPFSSNKREKLNFPAILVLHFGNSMELD